MIVIHTNSVEEDVLNSTGPISHCLKKGPGWVHVEYV